VLPAINEKLLKTTA